VEAVAAALEAVAAVFLFRPASAVAAAAARSPQTTVAAAVVVVAVVVVVRPRTATDGYNPLVLLQRSA
jgi:hypothetical protein